jgi:carboxypeptidase C (cathepsin A)
VRGKLGFESDLPYEVISERVHPWSFAQHENRYVDVAETLRRAMSEHPYLRVYVASGYYDLATPYFATEYTFAHLGLEPELRKNISFGYYEAGHMMYIHLPSLAKLRDELVAFIG